MATADDQYLESPGFPQFYPDNLNCSWTLTAPSGGTISLRVLSMFLEHGFDHLSIGG